MIREALHTQTEWVAQSKGEPLPIHSFIASGGGSLWLSLLLYLCGGKEIGRLEVGKVNFQEQNQMQKNYF